MSAAIRLPLERAQVQELTAGDRVLLTGVMYTARDAFCGSEDWKQSSSLNWGAARVILANGFNTQQECYDGFANIIVDCYGKRDGGVYTYSDNGHDARLDVDFCECE